MSYVGSVSPTLTVTVAIPIHSLSFSVLEVLPEGGTVWKGGTIKIDGVTYNIGSGDPRSITLPVGNHTTQVIIPSGYQFIQWSDAGGAVIDNVNATSTGFTTSDDGGIFAYIEQTLITTALSINLVQTPPIEPDTPITFTGKFTRQDTGAGLGGQTFNLEQPPGTVVNTGVTDSNGNYSITVTAPTEEGTYQYRTSFTGTVGLAGTLSGTLGIGVGVEATNILSIAALAAIAYAFLKRG